MIGNQPEPQAQLQFQLLPQPQFQLQVLSEPQPSPQAQVLSEPQAQPQAQALSEPQPSPQAQPQAQPQTVPQPEEEVKTRVFSRLLLFLLGSSLCVSVLGLAYYSHQNLAAVGTEVKKADNPNPNPAVFPCLTPACQEASARLALSVDPFTQPCDYFLFTCGSDGSSLTNRGRQRGKGLPPRLQVERKRDVDAGRQGRGRKERQTDREEEEVTDRMLDRQTALLQSLKAILEVEDLSGPASPAVQKARGFYRSCMEKGPTESAGAEPFLRLIQKLGGWAVSGAWNQTDFNSTLSLLMRDYATFPFFNLYVGKDPNDVDPRSNKKYIQIDQPDFQIPIVWSNEKQKSKANTQTLRPFLASCEKYLALLGSAPISNSLHVGLFISLSSELAVTAAPLHHRLQLGLLYQRKTIRELQTLAPAIDWLGCLQAAFHPHPVSQLDQVLLHNLPYIIQMSRIIGKWLNKHELSASGPIHTYMILSLLQTFIPALDSRFSETDRKFSSAQGYTEKQKLPRWKQCVLETEKGFDTVLTCLLHKTTVHKEMEEMTENIFSSLKSKLADLKWRDEESHQSVVNKVWSLTPRLSSKGAILHDTELDQMFSKVTIREHDYFSNYVQSLSLQQKKRIDLFSETEENNLSITLFISGEDLVFPIGLFVPPLFHPTYPPAVNYGVLGSLIAKDILHLLLPDIHSQSETVQTVGECVWEHYVRVTQGAGRVGAFSLSSAQRQEMWVQYSALQVALQAYHLNLKQRPDDSSLSGLSHTHLFLTSFTQINCDSDPYREFMPFEPSFLVTVLCTNSELCPTTMTCPDKPQQNLTNTC
ncbi:kell blood group glycoprotein [Osmerus eperlanus]|uniref:kell blood group glycoprotein n=1 Tax=Osmerus eperlanus TaxID=29151 RepID=UPI002E12A8D0